MFLEIYYLKCIKRGNSSDAVRHLRESTGSEFPLSQRPTDANKGMKHGLQRAEGVNSF